MATAYIVRHGQASLGKENYDELSETGHTQSRVLGEYFANQSIEFSHVITGTLNRHIQTAKGISEGLSSLPSVTHLPQWNEFDFKTLVNAYLKSDINKAGFPSDKKGYFIALKKAMLAWQTEQLVPEKMESWREFEERIVQAIEHLSQLSKDDNALIVTSGGAISMAISQLHSLKAAQMIDLNLEIKNTSVTTLNIKKDRLVLSSFNTSPHIDNVNYPELSTYA